MSSKVLITGANGAFGKLTVNALIAAGHSVAAAMRAPEGRNRALAEELGAAGAAIVEIDVTDDTSVSSGVAAAFSALGGLDVLVNMAGTGAHGLTEGFTPRQMLELYDINVVGTHRVTRAVLPLFREKQDGLVVNVSSLLGRLTIPFYGPYSATKFALETLTETYRVELSGFGIDVALVEPGGFATSFISSSVLPGDQTRLSEIGGFAEVPRTVLENYEAFLKATPAQDPQRVGDAIAALIATPAGTRPFRTVIDYTGMAEAVVPYNEMFDTITRNVYAAMGTENMLELSRT